MCFCCCFAFIPTVAGPRAGAPDGSDAALHGACLEYWQQQQRPCFDGCTRWIWVYAIRRENKPVQARASSRGLLVTRAPADGRPAHRLRGSTIISARRGRVGSRAPRPAARCWANSDSCFNGLRWGAAENRRYNDAGVHGGPPAGSSQAPFSAVVQQAIASRAAAAVAFGRAPLKATERPGLGRLHHSCTYIIRYATCTVQ